MALGSPTYTNSTIDVGKTVNKGVDLKDLLTNLNNLKANVKLKSEVKLNSELANKTHFAKSDVDHIRAAINSMETQFSGNCDCVNPASFTAPTITQCKETVKTKVTVSLTQCSKYTTIGCQSECISTCQTFTCQSSGCQNIVDCTNQSNQYECSGCQRTEAVTHNCDCNCDCSDSDTDNGP